MDTKSTPVTHTPGPWRVHVKPDRTMMVVAPAGHYIAKVVGSTAMGDVRERFAADADLIAAAPELLAALHAAESVLRAIANADATGLSFIRSNLAGPASMLQQVDAAIAKATGQG